ncbi:uncharacterized protein LOC129776953 [Toxorhynchites rutilus septentrionalis]|uniref:uncharacterized protein LOC129776953 n=1 Tax=Toxorhynchites rutilus septentrionalis TaxID=329112 RepID=UPI00247AA6AD|nr:uncharacterized protein LOC129776953 [Toxorhynchites rutilus septentrionalis]
MDTSVEDLNESMTDVIERAEAYLSAHSSLSNRNTLDQSIENLFDSTITERSFETAHETSDCSEAHTSSNENPRNIAKNDSATFNRVSITATGNSRPEQEEIEVLSDDSDDTVLYNVVHEEAPNPQRNGDADNDDCIVTAETNREPIPTVATIDLSSTIDENMETLSRQRRRNRRRRLDINVPIVESITLDDSISDMQPYSHEPGNAGGIVYSSPPKRTKTTAVDLESSSEGGASSNSIICPICFDSIFKKDPSSTICGHLFCYSCISQEIQLRKKCPLCKRKLTRAQVHPIYFS